MAVVWLPILCSAVFVPLSKRILVNRLLSLFILILMLTPAVFAMERITDYDTQITVAANGELSIVETITVNAEHKQIKRGIYRDFPTTYASTSGALRKVGFDLQLVRRDGDEEPYKLVEQQYGVRVYIGDKNQYIQKGGHQYELFYTTDRQLQFFQDRVELYFNAIPHKFKFPIDQASVKVTLPQGAKILKSKAFTGPMGSRQENADIQMLADNIITFKMREPLGVKQGVTIVLAIENGAILPPTASQEKAWFIADHKNTLIVSAVYLAFLGVLALLWYCFGKDPKRGTIIPRFEPPKGLSPAVCQYLTHRTTSAKTFAVALLSLATKGYVYIGGSSKVFSIIKSDKDLSGNPPLSRGEKLIFTRFFQKTKRVRVGSSFDSNVAATSESFKEIIETHYREENLISNVLYSVLAAIAFVVLSVYLTATYFDGDAKTLAFVFGTIGALTTVMFAGSSMMVYRNHEKRKAVIYFGAWLVSVAANLWVLQTMTAEQGFALPVFIHVSSVIAVSLMVNLFCLIIDAPTVAGRKLLDEIEGFKWYLSVAEGDDIKGLTLPAKTSQLYERYLPYALALGVQNQWAEQFSGVLEAAQTSLATSPNSEAYRLTHLLGTVNDLDSGFSGALQTSSIDPAASGGGSGGSSSGFSGGSSGGGGGGGGGGGW